MSYHQYPKPISIDNGSQDFVINEMIKNHLSALDYICRQCRDREIFPDELEPHLTALAFKKNNIEILGRRLIRCLKIEIHSLRVHDVMWCVERIKAQFIAPPSAQ